MYLHVSNYFCWVIGEKDDLVSIFVKLLSVWLMIVQGTQHYPRL